MHEDDDEVTRVAERFLRAPDSGIGDIEADPRSPELLLTTYALIKREMDQISNLSPVVETSVGVFLTLVLHNALAAARRVYGQEFTEEDEALWTDFSALHRAALKVGGVHNAVAIHRTVFQRLRELSENRYGRRLPPVMKACFPLNDA